MGLLTGLVTLPVAPIRAVIAITELLVHEAEEQLENPTVLRRELDTVAELRDRGLIEEEEAADLEDDLIRRLIAARKRRGPRKGN